MIFIINISYIITYRCQIIVDSLGLTVCYALIFNHQLNLEHKYILAAILINIYNHSHPGIL